MKISPSVKIINFKSSTKRIEKRDLDAKDVNNHPILSNPNVNFYSCYTYFFREDVGENWKNFIKAIDKHFSGAEKVNVFNFGCSDGSEAHSFLMCLFDTLGAKKAKKFLPIQAFDIDQQIIDSAKSGKILCSREDMNRINRNCPTFYKYCNIYYDRSGFDGWFVPKENLKNELSFSKGDFTEKINDLPPKNNLIMCRNMWYYLGEDKIFDILYELSEKIDETSLVVIGDFDRKYVLAILDALNFEEITMNVFKKRNLKK